MRALNRSILSLGGSLGQTLGASLLSVVVAAQPALAEPSSAPVPVAASSAARAQYSVVGLMLSSAQALLWDGATGEYVLRRVGDELEGARIVGVEVDHLVLDRNGAREEVDLDEAPSLRVPERRDAGRAPATLLLGARARQSAAPARPSFVASRDPYAPAAPAAPAAPPALAPSVALAPSTIQASPPVYPPQPAPSFSPLAAAPLPPTAASAPPAPPSMTTETGASPQGGFMQPAPARPAAPLRPLETPPTLVSRVEFDQRLGDFERIGQDVVVEPDAAGGYRLSALRPGSYLASLGLRAGDVVLAIDGRPVNNPDDAARAYAWLRVADHFRLDLVRGGERLQLRFQVTG